MPPPAPGDNSYLDLTPGSRLRILVPLLSAGQNHLALGSSQADGNTITLSAANLVGYQVSYYLAEGHRNGKVHLQFASAEMTKDGHTVPEPVAPHLPFQLPQRTHFIRLVFLVRVSESDHNMAIVAANTKDALAAFTAQLKQNPSACQVTENVSCVWVPEGIAVRPESPSESKQQRP
jgi:hypothetical protein